MLNLLRAAGMSLAALAVLTVGGAHGALADDATQAPASTRPSISSNDGNGMRPGPAFVIRRYKNAVSGLDLTDDEKPKVDAVFDKVNQEGLDLSQSIGNGELQDRYQKLGEFSREIRQELAGVLTSEQMSALDAKIGNGFTSRRGGQGFGGRRFQGSGQDSPGQQNGNGSTPVTAGGASNGNGAGGAVGRGAGGGVGMLELVEQAVAKLDLSDDQKVQIKNLIASTRAKLTAIRNSSAADDDKQQQLKQARQDVRDKLQDILTPEQFESFTDSMRTALQQRGVGSGAAGAGPRVNGDTPISSKPVPENKPEDLQSSGPEAGSPAPSVEITETNGRTFDPSKYKGRVVVLEFGSMSCPVFRERVQDMEKLKMAEGPRAFFLVVYTREAFPAGDKNVERNRAEGISITDASDLDGRKTQAMETASELRITMPMAVDSMDDAVSNAFGGFPNGAVVIGKDGNIASRQQWTNPDTLRGAIDDAYSAPDSGAH